MRLASAFALALLAALPAIPAPGTGMVFAAPVLLPDAFNDGEPGVAVAGDGTIYVVAPEAHTGVWRSTNGGASFQHVADSRGDSGDSDVSVTPDGTLYVSDMCGNTPVSVSTNKGTSFAYVSNANVASCDDGIDRQWIAAPADGVVFSGVNQGGTFTVSRSDDAALTWTHKVAFTDASFPPPGQLVAPTVDDVYVPYASGNGFVRLAVSHDGGATWASRNVAAFVDVQGLGGTALFPTAAVDRAGTIYVVWADGGATGIIGGTRVRVAFSTDGGGSWSAPRTLSEPTTTTSGTYNVFPWVVADAPGKVAVAWYEGAPPAGARTLETAAAGTDWYVRVAYSSAAASATPGWTSSRVTGVFYTGPICTMGTGCLPVATPVAGNRILLDFFEAAETPTGNLVLSYPSYYPNALSKALSSTQLRVLVQTGGPNLK